jgi:multiple sugar transport system substrate-binding protein
MTSQPKTYGIQIMKTNHKLIKNGPLSIILIMILSVLLFSCNDKKTADENQITLEWWHFWTDPSIRPAIEQVVADYEADNPGIKIKLTDLTWANGHEKIVVAFSSGSAPDIIELGSDWVPEFSHNSQLASITEMVVRDTGDFYCWDPGIYNDSIYAHPWILGTRVLYLNRDLISSAGLGENFVPVNWHDLHKVCYAVDSLGDDIYGFGSNAAEKHRLYKKYMPFFWSMNGYLLGYTNRFAGFAGDQAYKSMKFYKELHDSCSLVDTQRRLEDAFLDGKIGVIISGDWLLKRIKNENRNINFTTSLIPGPQFPGKSFAGGEYLAVSKSSNHKAEAIDFIKHITNEKNQLEFCKANYSANPSNKETAKDEFFTSDPNLQTFVKQIVLSRMPPADPQWVYLEEIVESTLEKILFEGEPIAETLYEANKEIQKIMDSR